MNDPITEEEKMLLTLALDAADRGDANHWPTVASILAFEYRRIGRENVDLRTWKDSAISVLNKWEEVWDASGLNGTLGQSKAECVKEYLLDIKPKE